MLIVFISPKASYGDTMKATVEKITNTQTAKLLFNLTKASFNNIGNEKNTVLDIANPAQEQLLLQAMSNVMQLSIGQSSPYGPKVEALKGKNDIVQNFEAIKRVRGTLTIIDIRETTSKEQLQKIYKDLEGYIAQFNIIKSNLERHKITYKNSLPDLFFAEQIMFIVDSYSICLRQQQNLIVALENDKIDAKKLFYSSYLIPVYYYINLADQMVAYVETYFVIA